LTTSYEVTSLSKFLSEFPEERVSKMLSSFSCEKDRDVESFLREKAIVQEKKQISRTYLIFTSERNEIAAYFSIAISSMDVTDLECSNELRKKMNINNKLAQSYLIGQLGRSDGSPKGLGKFMILSAIERIKDANLKVGCRVIRLDCRSPLVKYYNENGFILAGRDKERDLNQMVRIMDARTAASP